MERNFKITAPEGLHARPAALLVTAATPFSSSVEVIHNGQTANLKSIISVMAQGIKTGAEVGIKTDGEDAEQALSKIAEVILKQGIGEEC